MNQQNNLPIPFLAEIESAKVLLSGILDTNPNAPELINDLILLFESFGEREDPADTWIFAEELQLFLYSKTDDCVDRLVDYKDGLKAKSGKSVAAASVASDDFDDSTLSEANADTLALALSEVLRNENLPESVFNAIQTGLNDVYNELDNLTVNDFESSPEYISFVLNGAKRTEGAQ